MPEREREVALEIELGVRGERVGWWGKLPGRSLATHFWLPVKWNPLGPWEETRYESACGRWDVGRYGQNAALTLRNPSLGVMGNEPRPLARPWEAKRVCHRCAFAVEAEGA
jgi:hypothetical protein